MFARHTIDEHGLGTTITSIDPMPRAEVDALCDTVVRKPLQEVGHDLFRSLRAGDIVLVDSTNFTTLFGGTDSLENFWRNLAMMR